ncbi:cache domain-containing sensor histidine kinase [Petroclostridium xylanilyticum]|uniref:cache domain-containing sensor histidine kinase n=1 Tax=Petroclostridium xylanilyticum TaxID=1792311 RepID=UPI001FA8BC36|nr:sensor histidine kinase [Petroclostridium xylanilyticum]
MGLGKIIHDIIGMIKKLVKTSNAILASIFSPGSCIRNISIQTRLLSSFFVFSLIPLLITGTFSYYMSSSAIKAKISTYSLQIMKQISKNIQREINKFENDSIEIQFSDIVQDALKRYDKMGQWEKKDLESSLKDIIIKKFSSLYDVSDVLIYTNNVDKIIAYGNDLYILKLKPEYLNMILNDALEKKGVPVWTAANLDHEMHYLNNIYDSNERNGILLCRSIRDIADGEQIGYILMRVHEKYFSNIYRDIDIGKDSLIFVLNSNGWVISSPYPDMEVAKEYKHQELLSELKYHQQKGEGIFNKSIDNNNYLVAFSHVENTDWYVVSLIPYAYLTAEARRVGLYTVIVSMACLILAISLSFLISKSISVPLKRLIHSMNEMKEGNLSISIEDKSKDEISKVTNNFNMMVEEIKTLLRNVEMKERQKRIAELKALQAQINPHFLSNTLNNVRWLARIQNADNIEKLITSLIYLLHGSMGKGDELITVMEEINYLKNYITIQEYRYYDKFKVSFKIEEEVLNYKILRFVLQPILENSIIHGIEPMNGQGLIVIKAFTDADHLKITVTDNGVGIPKEKLEGTLSHDPYTRRSRFNGMGLANVEERIKLFFGPQYGIFIQSIPDFYTTVEIILPIIKKEGGLENAQGINS